MDNIARQAGNSGSAELPAGGAGRDTLHEASGESAPSASVSWIGPPVDGKAHTDMTNGSRRRPKVFIAFAMLLAVVVGIWWMSHNRARPAGAAPASDSPLEFASVDVAAVEPRVLARTLPLSGSISPVVQATVKSRVAGDIEQLTVREGQDVKQGDVIARIDTRNLQAQYDRAVAAVDKARADMELATLNRDKNKKMLEQHYISQNTFEATESAYAGSVASLRLAEADARLAKVSLDDAVVRAPFAGTIAKRLAQPGEKVSPDAALVSLVDLRQMLLEAMVPAADIPAVNVGQRATFTVGGFGERQFTGEVQRISPVTESGSRAITIYIAVANSDRVLKGGMFAQGDLALTNSQSALAIEQRSVHEEAGAAFVYTLQDGKIARMPVTLGPRVKGNPYVEVLAGLKQGDRLILTNVSEAKIGARAIVRGDSDKAKS